MGAAFILPAIGAAANYINQRNANNRGQAAATAAINNQSGFRTQAMNDVAQTTNQIAKNSPDAIANQENSNFVSNLRSNMAKNSSPNGPTSALGPVPGANSRYGAGVAAGTAATQGYGNTQAGDMSAIDAAVKQRQNEGLQLQTLGTNLNQIGAASNAKSFVDNLRTQAVSQTSPWVSLFSKMATGAGSALAMSGNKGIPVGDPNSENPDAVTTDLLTGKKTQG